VTDTIFDDALNDLFTVLGCEVIYEGATIHGYFKSPSHTIDAATGEITTGAPGVEVRTCDVPGIAQGKQVVIAGTTYNVVAPPFTDGKGTTILELATI
jgi:hypothetical protein